MDLDPQQVNDWFDEHRKAFGRSEFMDAMREAVLTGIACKPAPKEKDELKGEKNGRI